MNGSTLTLTALLLGAVAAPGVHAMKPDQPAAAAETATLGGGCFWCLEAVYEELEGVASVVSGYAGGRNADPTYDEVCGGDTGHAEVVRLVFDPRVIDYREILRVFFTIHDPTTLNRQGADRGTQYRSVIFYHSESQRAAAAEAIAALNASGAYDARVVTELSPVPDFYPAEAYHQDYYRRNPDQGYCRAVINPKLARFRERFPERRK